MCVCICMYEEESELMINEARQIFLSLCVCVYHLPSKVGVGAFLGPAAAAAVVLCVSVSILSSAAMMLNEGRGG